MANEKTELDRWKRKYLLSVEQFESKSKEWKEAINHLRQGLSRVSVAASGVDPELDAQLAAIRKGIRSQVDHKKLQGHIEAISKTLHALDDAKSARQCQTVRCLERLLTLFQAMSLPSHIAGKVKYLEKSMQSSEAEKQAVSILNGFIEVVMDVVKLENTEAPSQPEKQSIWEKMWAGKSSSKLQSSLVQPRMNMSVDPLTSLPNKEAYNKYLSESYVRWKRYNEGLILAVGEIDNFKSINDNCGHLAGDKVLTDIAQVLKDNLRAVDFVGRYAGEKFVFVLEKTPLESASKIFEKLRQLVEECKFHFSGNPVKITMSFGVSELQSGNEPKEVFERADKALYEAKDKGHNCIITK